MNTWTLPINTDEIQWALLGAVRFDVLSEGLTSEDAERRIASRDAQKYFMERLHRQAHEAFLDWWFYPFTKGRTHSGSIDTLTEQLYRAVEQIISACITLAREAFPEADIAGNASGAELFESLKRLRPDWNANSVGPDVLAELLREEIERRRNQKRARGTNRRLPDALPQQTFMEARNAGIAFADARRLRRWQEELGEIALRHVIPGEPIHTKLTAGTALAWWGLPETYDSLRDELRSMELSGVLLLHNLIGAALQWHQVTASLDELMRVIGWSPRSVSERTEMRRKIWRWLLIFDSVTMHGLRPGTYKDKLTNETFDLTSRDALIKITGNRPARQPAFDNSEPPIEVTWVAGPWLDRLRGNDHVLQYFGNLGKIASIPSKQPRGAWAQSIGLALHQLWRERAANAQVKSIRGKKKLTVAFENPFTRYELLDLFRAEPWVEDLLAGNTPKRAQQHWKDAIKLLKGCGIVGLYKELKPLPTNRKGWQHAWLFEQTLDIRPREESIKAIVELSRKSSNVKRALARKHSLQASK